MIIIPNKSSRVPIDVPTAIILALPPIQLPERAPIPCHASTGSQGPNKANEIAPPTTTPIVPISIMNIAFGPSLAKAGKLADSNNNIRAGGNR